MKNRSPLSLSNLLLAAIGAACLYGFYILGHYRYIMFHTVAELFTITVSIAVFLVAWNTRKIAKNNFFLFVGNALFFTALLSIVHLMSYKGMGIIPGIIESNVATQLWIAKQYLLSVSLLAASFITWRNRPLKIKLTFFLYAAAVALTLLSIFYWHTFPASFVNGTGLTLFKKISEYIISAIFLGAALMLNTKRSMIDAHVKRLLVISYVILIASELSFTLYNDVYGIFNFAGHILGLAAFIVLYQAIIVYTLERPFQFLFSELAQSNASLKEAVKQESAAEEKITEERDRVEMYLQSIGDGVVVVDRNGKVLLWNTSAATISGYDKPQAVGADIKTVIRLLDEQSRHEYFSFLEEAMENVKIQQTSGHIILIRKDESELPVVCTASPVMGTGGVVDGAIVTVHDCTQEREASRLRSDFAYASHQLRTPISKAILLLQMALEETDPDKMRADAQESYDALQSIGTLSEQLIIVSKIDQGMIIPTIEAIRLSSFVDETVKAVASDAQKMGITVSVELAAKTATVTTGKNLLKQALLEVLRNAVIYSEKNGTVKFRISERNGDLLFDVYNRGIGIEQEHQALAFTKFFRGNNFDTSKIPGTGLGLYIAKEYIKLLRGKIWFTSEPGKETTFYLSLPLQHNGSVR